MSQSAFSYFCAALVRDTFKTLCPTIIVGKTMNKSGFAKNQYTVANKDNVLITTTPLSFVYEYIILYHLSKKTDNIN